jgi:hypothetical protein
MNEVDCPACHHVALLTAEALLRLGPAPGEKVLNLKGRLRCRGCGRRGRAAVSIKWRGQRDSEGSRCGDPSGSYATADPPTIGKGAAPGGEMTSTPLTVRA